MDDLISRQAAIDAIGNVPDHDDGMVWEALSHAQRDVALLPSVQQWVPVTERLPLKPGFYMVTVGAPYKPVRVYEYKPCEGYENENLWKGEDGAYVFNWFVKAWQNLPEPWKGEADDRD